MGHRTIKTTPYFGLSAKTKDHEYEEKTPLLLQSKVWRPKKKWSVIRSANRIAPICSDIQKKTARVLFFPTKVKSGGLLFRRRDVANSVSMACLPFGCPLWR